METREWMNVDQLAEYLGYTKSWVYKAVLKHEIPVTRMKGGHNYRFHKPTIDAHFIKKTTKPVKKELPFAHLTPMEGS